MPQRPPSLAQRLRSVWASHPAATAPAGGPSARHAQAYKGAEFADRLRAAVAARH
jgi:hypothetical protein